MRLTSLRDPDAARDVQRVLESLPDVQDIILDLRGNRGGYEDQADRIERLSPARAVATVGASLPYVHELGLRHDGLTELIARFCQAVPAADLHFTRSAKFWSLLTAEFKG